VSPRNGRLAGKEACIDSLFFPNRNLDEVDRHSKQVALFPSTHSRNKILRERFERCNWQELIPTDRESEQTHFRVSLSPFRAVEGVVSSETNRAKSRTKETTTKYSSFKGGRVRDGSQSLRL